MVREIELVEGQRIGRFVVLRDTDGVLHAIAAASVSAIREEDGVTLILLPGGRLVRAERALATVLSWLEMGPQGA
ncbi:hypothetical protein EAH89_14605 [Roseomonas nepalensis]|uniref:Uncharacterized protein n=2 Tax=Muricoccus nepalensis TaxID=1854500 RepID=A0A502G122_9PROT|nr:hypothetical protein EAH89_14605 [Roseomonas nepalensis]